MKEIIIDKEKENNRNTQDENEISKSETGFSLVQRIAKRFGFKRDYLVHPFKSICFLPLGVTFETKEKDEEVIVLLRRHPITNFRWILIFLVFVLSPLITIHFPVIDFLPPNYKLMVLIGWYLLSLAFFLENFLSWFYSVMIITDRRVIDLDFFNLLYKQVTEAGIDKIQDVTLRTGGAANAIFNYGDVLIQTAGEIQNIDFISIPDPNRVVRILRALIEEVKREV